MKRQKIRKIARIQGKHKFKNEKIEGKDKIKKKFKNVENEI